MPFHFAICSHFLVRKYLASVQSSVLVNRGWVPRSWRNKFFEDSDEVRQPPNVTTVDEVENKHGPWWKFWSKQPPVAKVLVSHQNLLWPTCSYFKIINEQCHIPEKLKLALSLQDHEEHNTEQVKVVAVVRGSEKPSIFVPANDPSTGQWFYVDVPGIVHALGLPESTIYVEDVNENVKATKPYPVPKDVNSLISHSVMPRDHLNYAFTWYVSSPPDSCFFLQLLFRWYHTFRFILFQCCTHARLLWSIQKINWYPFSRFQNI